MLVLPKLRDCATTVQQERNSKQHTECSVLNAPSQQLKTVAYLCDAMPSRVPVAVTIV
jgi:hypothetical protein